MSDHVVHFPHSFYTRGEELETLIERYGGADFAVRFNKNSPAGYSIGPYSMIGHANGACHSHLDNVGYSLDQKTFGTKVDPFEVVLTLAKEEEWRNVLNLLIICLFARNIYTHPLGIECLKNIGIEKTEDELITFGLEIQKLRIASKLQFGFDHNSLSKKISKRLFEMPTGHGKLSESQILDLIKSYKLLLKQRYFN